MNKAGKARGLIIFIFLVIIQAKSFAANICLSESTSEINPMVVKMTTDTGILGSELVTRDTPILISSQFAFTEGPAADKNGNVYFTDQPNDKIWKYDTNGKLSVFMENAGRSNGLYFDKKGNLISCADEQNQLWNISSGKKVKVLIKDFNGQNFNGPNDLWVNPVTGGIYFTDPYYKRDYWGKEHPHIKEQRVYHLSKNKKKAAPVEDDMVRPNGIIGTPDGKFLYIADIGGSKTFRYNINNDGTLSDKQLFANQGSDGMTIDNEGNIYLTGKGITIYNPQGEMIHHIPVPEDWTANICFSGKDKNVLFITASKSIYILPMKVKGVR